MAAQDVRMRLEVSSRGSTWSVHLPPDLEGSPNGGWWNTPVQGTAVQGQTRSGGLGSGVQLSHSAGR